MAENCFYVASKEDDIAERSLFNLALTEYKLNKHEKFIKTINKLQELAATNNSFITYEIALLFFLINEYEKAAKWIIKLGINRIDLLDWKELAYSIFLTDEATFAKELKKGISNREKWIKEINDHHPDWVGYSEEEKSRRLKEFQNEIRCWQNIDTEFQNKPNLVENELLVIAPMDCLLYDCCGNLKND